ncbi:MULTISPECIES: branched-chain amino acid transport system II carrier protein [Sutcliffiella]|uniref:Branched-chain amino acid transport system carrier protein n=1 Tax=Sutcliffiella cohnii TaxID=33932 RepID=A0A223KTN6_9BACI|nr:MULTISPECIES: branched-chain amino acid transport system II carrier protein [Sutcliffiella]AST92862.1 branched-chain amino acid transport system II carrier protein [Sutcliffiella cohnii]MED4016183.1 branched-chain amino acid transport system II carrier protein [Sutcliffiella cohnii]WBL14120.1 branched-chain amino acid transport system II carrier protein [Sutcliffiella sp. NC1]
MSNNQFSKKDVFILGLMLFALFLGAGNLIFPPLLGQSAGTNIWIAVIGFLITGVGLPLLGVLAIAFSGGDLQVLANRVNPTFGIIFTMIMYLAIGPFFGIPRTGTVAFEIGAVPFLPDGNNALALLIYTLIFFSISYYLALNPTKLVSRIGKILTPILLVVIGILVFKSILTPMGTIGTPTETYATNPFFTGFIEGYLTMDTIAALVFGIVIISSIRDRGITDKKTIATLCMKAGIIAAIGLTIVYASLAFLGATSLQAIGEASNGGVILSRSANYLFGSFGALILGLAITFACLTTSVGLISACSKFFEKTFPTISYKAFVAIFSLFSMAVANVGLDLLISISLPVLITIYPLAIVLIVLSFLRLNNPSTVYIFSLIFTACISIVDGLTTAGIHLPTINAILSFLPLFEEGVGWLFPAIIGALIGYILSRKKLY